VTYTVANQWPGGFQGTVRVTNRSATPVTGWTLRWSFPNGQVVTSLWNGTVTQSGAAVTVTNAAYNGTLAGNGGSAEVGFQASWTGTNGRPAAFTLNGASCASA
jgi:cellulase/cellobiase CelA1